MSTTAGAPSSGATWDPLAEGAQLTNKLSSRGRHVNLFFGAGTSRAAGLPDVTTLTGLVLADMQGELRQLANDVLRDRNLEEALSRVRRIRALLQPGQKFEGFTAETATQLDLELSASIRKHLSKDAVVSTAHQDLARWVMGDYYTRPVEIFTVNYDLVIEQALESIGAPYFDGFVGNLQAGFRADLVEATGGSADSAPASFARVWKLHGSLNWRVTEAGQIRRTGDVVRSDQMAAIYPSDEKYDQSRRVPFSVLQDRFRRALAVPESITLVAGYSFGDQHLNEILFDASHRHPRNEVVVFCYGDIYPALEPQVAPNMTVYGASEAIVAGQRRPWASLAPEPKMLWKDGRFQLGDFSALAGFLAHTSRLEEWTPVGADGAMA